MHTLSKPKHRVLDNSLTLCSSKVSTDCDFDRDEGSQLSKKKFARKRQSSDESMESFKVHQAGQGVNRKQNSRTSQNNVQSFQKAGKQIQELSFRKQPIFQSKYVKIQTERPHYQSMLSLSRSSFNLPTIATRRGSRTKTQQTQVFLPSNFELKFDFKPKNSDSVKMQDENSRLKKQIKKKQVQIDNLEKLNLQLKNQHDGRIRALGQKIKTLQINIARKDEAIQKADKMATGAKQQLKKTQSETQLLRVQVEQLLSNKTAIKTPQVASYRQASLKNQILQLKEQLGQSKSQINTKLQQQLQTTRVRLTQQIQSNSSLLIANRVLVKKNNEARNSAEKRSKLQMNQLKSKLVQLIKQSSVVRKQNASLKKSLCQNKRRSENNCSPMLTKANQKRTNRLWSIAKKGSQNDDSAASDDSFTFSLSR